MLENWLKYLKYFVKSDYFKYRVEIRKSEKGRNDSDVVDKMCQKESLNVDSA